MHTVVVEPGEEVAGRYRLDDLQGRGPTSQVWRAHDRTLDRAVALKILSPTADLERFRREAQVLATLGHANVVRVYDYGEDGARPFMALEWLSGGTLEERLAQGPLPPEETHRVAAGIAGGLAHLHGRGLVHGELEPANVLFDEEGRPKLADSGVAADTGTTAYTSPEQAAGQPAGPASDVYSFGVVLFRMLTGALPSVDGAATAADERRDASSRALAALAAAALREDPAERPADGEALLGAFVAAPAGAETTQVLPAAPRASARRFGRGATVAVAALVLLATAGGVLAWAVASTDRAAPAAGLASTVSGPKTQHTSAVAGTTLPETTQTADHVRRHRKRKQHAATTTAPTTQATTAPATTTEDTTTTEPTTTAPTTTAPTTTAPTTTAPTTTAPTTTAATT